MKTKNLLAVLFLCVTLATTAQDFQEERGNLSFLKDQKVVNVEFKYDHLRLMKDNVTEKEYVDERREFLNNRNKGEGDNWLKKWEGAREAFWEPKFLDLMRRTVTESKGIVFQKDAPQAAYTLIVDAQWIYPGWDAWVMKQKAKVTTVLSFVETNNRENVLYQIRSIEAPGDQIGHNYSNELRIGEGFEKTAKSFGKLIIKRLKK
ncbi:Uncharacterised protein [Capnocytophaga ochracea]|uniref:DUF4468 domain-containing protein n=1 Tax=Capnocytophaga ochracea TaxID=1018 RepID=A0A7Z8YB89_CAPOC|nr:hypothetical protein [Capnocytophaga ochracea]VDG81114.1 Uncharacterised protein [Capnocytophaga ochracea]